MTKDNNPKRKWLLVAFIAVVTAVCVLLVLRGTKGAKSLVVDASDFLVSPDGRYCLGTKPLQAAKMHLIDLQNMRDQEIPLAQIDPVNLAWGPDSRSVYTTSFSSTDQTVTFYSAAVPNVSPERKMFQLRNEQPIALSPSPDGKSLAFFNHLSRMQLCIYDIGTRRLTRVPGYQGSSGGNELSWSADGRTVVFAARTNTHQDGLVVYDVSRTATRFINCASDYFAISPDGQALAAVSLKSYPNPSATVTILSSANGQVLRSLGYSASVAGRVLWSRDSRAIYYVSHLLEKQPQVERLDIASGQQRILIGPGRSSVVSLIGIRNSTLYYSTSDDVSPSQLSQLPL